MIKGAIETVKTIKYVMNRTIDNKVPIELINQ